MRTIRVAAPRATPAVARWGSRREQSPPSSPDWCSAPASPSLPPSRHASRGGERWKSDERHQCPSSYDLDMNEACFTELCAWLTEAGLAGVAESDILIGFCE